VDACDGDDSLVIAGAFLESGGESADVFEPIEQSFNQISFLIDGFVVAARCFTIGPGGINPQSYPVV